MCDSTGSLAGCKIAGLVRQAIRVPDAVYELCKLPLKMLKEDMNVVFTTTIQECIYNL